jgi:hypothetical protein
MPAPTTTSNKSKDQLVEMSAIEANLDRMGGYQGKSISFWGIAILICTFVPSKKLI